jgi:hypothetical protein
MAGADDITSYPGIRQAKALTVIDRYFEHDADGCILTICGFFCGYFKIHPSPSAHYRVWHTAILYNFHIVNQKMAPQ